MVMEARWTGAIAGKVGFAYDNDFRLSQVTVNGANAIAYTYNADGLVVKAGSLNLTRDATTGLLSGTTLGVTGLLTVFIFPKIMPIFISLNITLPLTTRNCAGS